MFDQLLVPNSLDSPLKIQKLTIFFSNNICLSKGNQIRKNIFSIESDYNLWSFFF